MKNFTFTIKHKNGLHARPAGMIATTARGFESEVTVTTVSNGKTFSGKRLLSLMATGAKCGDELTVEVSGPDEETAVIAIKESFDTNLGED